MSIQDKAIKMVKRKQVNIIRGHMDSMILILDGIDCSKIECDECPMFDITCMKPRLRELLGKGSDIVEY